MVWITNTFYHRAISTKAYYPKIDDSNPPKPILTLDYDSKHPDEILKKLDTVVLCKHRTFQVIKKIVKDLLKHEKELYINQVDRIVIKDGPFSIVVLMNIEKREQGRELVIDAKSIEDYVTSMCRIAYVFGALLVFLVWFHFYGPKVLA
jgi:hypothetical protein